MARVMTTVGNQMTRLKDQDRQETKARMRTRNQRARPKEVSRVSLWSFTKRTVLINGHQACLINLIQYVSSGTSDEYFIVWVMRVSLHIRSLLD
jgi:hypothetical protein